MGTIFQLLLVVSIAIVAYNVFKFLRQPDIKFEMEEDGWFGAGQKRRDNEAIVPFQVKVPDDMLEDLKMRLERARILHTPLEDSDNFMYGFNANYLRTVIDYWRTKFDWRKQEKIINNFPQFTTEIEGLKIHFIHAKPPLKQYKRVVPLLIVHGWPGNVFEFYKIIPMLTNPSLVLGVQSDLAFEVIAPSIPGYGWSDSAHKTGLNQWATARIFRKLMLRLGHNKFLLQGGDWGSLVCTIFAHYYPQNVIGVHLNTVFLTGNTKATLLFLIGSVAPSLVFSSPSAHSFNLKNLMFTFIAGSGYLHLQGTEPDTVGMALNDSPAGLAAYILQKFAAWTNREYQPLPDGGLTQRFTMDELLTILSIYWFNGNIVNSQRYYKEYFISPQGHAVESAFLRIPTAVASFPNDLVDPAPREIVECTYNVVSFTEMPFGGHFAAFEQPKLLARDIFKFADILNL